MAHAALTALHGIGPWTADIYLLFCLGHADAWPAGDLARCRRPRASPSACASGRTPRSMAKLAEAWRPWRGVAAHLLWAYYHAVKRREGVPVSRTTAEKTAGETAKKTRKRNGTRMNG